MVDALHRIGPDRETVTVVVGLGAISLGLYVVTGDAFAAASALLVTVATPVINRLRACIGVSDRAAALVLCALSVCVASILLYYGVVVRPLNLAAGAVGGLFLALAYSSFGDARRATGTDSADGRGEG